MEANRDGRRCEERWKKDKGEKFKGMDRNRRNKDKEIGGMGTKGREGGRIRLIEGGK